MPSGGKLIIETSSVDLDDGYVRGHTGANPGSYVKLSMSDTGIGMNQEVRGHIFEPFFTTKEVGRGTGLGLATVYGIVKQSGGNIWVYSEPGLGTTFSIYLPRIKEATKTASAAAAGAEYPEGSGKVLLVEDDGAVRSLMSVILEDCGYAVVEASNGEEGLEIFSNHQSAIDLIITDVVMPRMSGKEMAERIQATRPEMKVLFVSGYTQIAVQHSGLLEGGSNFLQKPFTPKSLARKVQELMRSPEPARV
jgi:CheY-like chemotaxis protein